MRGMHARMRFFRCLPLLLSLLLSGCASLGGSPAGSPQTAGAVPAAAARSYIDAITLGGRLSVRYQNRGSEESIHGSFAWTQDAEHTRVTLLSPLGQTLALIDVTPEGATLTQGGRVVRSANEVGALVEQTLGWPLPVSGLREWLQGFGTDAAGARFIASPQAQDFTTRDGWRLSYVTWEENASASRPKRIDLERSTIQAGDVAIRIVLDTWQPR